MIQASSILVKNSGLIALDSFKDTPHGHLVVANLLDSAFNHSKSFVPKRLFFITSLHDPNMIRGKHAHKTLTEVIFCVSGSFNLNLDDGTTKQTLRLDDPAQGVVIGPDLWHTMTDFSHDCVMLVLADGEYDRADYIDGYDDFLAHLKTKVV